MRERKIRPRAQTLFQRVEMRSTILVMRRRFVLLGGCQNSEGGGYKAENTEGENLDENVLI